MSNILNFDPEKLNTPCFVLDELLLMKNLEILKRVKDETGAKILLAQKAFSMYETYPLIGEYLDGTTASGLFEAKLGKTEMGKETHIFSPGYREEEIQEIYDICDHMIFNSLNQYEKFALEATKRGISCGLRINPMHSTQDHEIYDPCGRFSRLGITRKNFPNTLPEHVEGLHFHTLCEQNVNPLKETLEAVINQFGSYFGQLKWINFGGGHHITREDYDVEALINLIKNFKERYNLQVYLEPGEAVALNAGFLVSQVIDVVENEMQILILDASAACHMPDVLEMPYRPPVLGSGLPGEKKYTYRLGTPTCLAGDIIGDYSFDNRLTCGDRIIFGDMAHYSMVKTNMFNGINLPSIYVLRRNKTIQLLKSFSFEDFKSRL